MIFCLVHIGKRRKNYNFDHDRDRVVHAEQRKCTADHRPCCLSFDVAWLYSDEAGGIIFQKNNSLCGGNVGVTAACCRFISDFGGCCSSINLGSITDASSLSMLDGRQQIIIIVIALIYAVAVMVLDLMITYRLTKGVQELQINTGADLKGDLLMKLWKAFSIMIVVSIVFIIIAAMYRGLILAAFIALAAAIVKIVYFGYFIRACVYYQKNRSIA